MSDDNDRPLIIRLGDITESVRPSLVGAKASGLARMQRLGANVPDGVVLTSLATAHFLQTGELPPSIFPRLSDELLRLTKDRERWFANESERGYAVRSGAAESQPGMMQTVLNCATGMPDSASPGEVHVAIQTVMRSWRSDEAVQYRRHWCIDSTVPTAVLVQWMVPAQISGVASSGDSGAVVEFVTGLGDRLVSGASHPDQIKLDERGRVTESSADFPANPQILAEIKRLLSLAEDEFGGSVEMEWAVAAEQVFVLQIRRNFDGEIRIARSNELSRVQHVVESQQGWLARHEMAESIYSPTPMTWSVLRPFLTGRGGFGSLYRHLGYAPDRSARREGVFELLGGQLYTSRQRLATMLADGCPPSVIEGRFEIDDLDPWFLFKLPWLGFVLWRAKRALRALTGAAAIEFDRQHVPEFRRFIEEQRQVRLGGLSDDDLVKLLELRRRMTLDVFAPPALLPATVGAILFRQFVQRLEQLTSSDDARVWEARILRDVSSDDSVVQALAQVANGERGKKDFLVEFGHRCSNEWELAVPRWHEEPDALDSLFRAPVSRLPTAETRLLEELGHLVSGNGSPKLAEDLVQQAKSVLTLLPYKERARHQLMLGFDLMRAVLLEVAKRHDLGSDVFFMELSELSSLSSFPDHEIIQQRRIEWRAVRSMRLPASLDQRWRNAQAEMAIEPADADLQGESLCEGTATGPICMDISDDSQFVPGSVVVVERIGPELVPVLIQAAAVIVERGGALSHGAAIVRQLNLPAVVIPDARQRLATWESVGVHGLSGVLKRIS